MTSLASIRLPPLPSVNVTVIDKVRIYVELLLYFLDGAYNHKYSTNVWECAKCS
jgi:hypothetical protein